MTARSKLLLVVSLALAAFWFAMPGFTGASFTSQSQNATSTVRAAGDWTPPTVSMDAVPGYVSGTVTVSATASDAETGVASVLVESSPTGSGTWTTVCSGTTAPYSCSWATSALTDGGYRLRATAKDNAGYSTTSAVVTTVVDNALPAVSMTAPAGTISGTVTLASTASDATSGVDNVVVQYSRNGASGWSAVCTDFSSPYSCSLDTTTLANGAIYFRAVATDRAGNTRTSASVSSTISNTVLTVTLADPGDWVKGTVGLTATGNATAGIKSITFQSKPRSGSTWASICGADTVSPYTCSWSTSGVGDYDLRAVITDNGNATASSAVVPVSVDNTVLAAYDVDGINKTGGTAGRLETGDKVVYTYNGRVDLATLSTGWDGTSKAVSVYFDDATTWSNGYDGWSVTGVNLGPAGGTANMIAAGQEFAVAATMVASTTTVGTNIATVVTLTITGTPPAAKVSTVPTGSYNYGWMPSALAKNYAGTASTTTTLAVTGRFF